MPKKNCLCVVRSESGKCEKPSPAQMEGRIARKVAQDPSLADYTDPSLEPTSDPGGEEALSLHTETVGSQVPTSVQEGAVSNY